MSSLSTTNSADERAVLHCSLQNTYRTHAIASSSGTPYASDTCFNEHCCQSRFKLSWCSGMIPLGSSLPSLQPSNRAGPFMVTVELTLTDPKRWPSGLPQPPRPID